MNNQSLTPDSNYVHTTNSGVRILSNTIIDAGAYEYDQMVSISENELKSLSLYPNPTNGILAIDIEANQVGELTVFNALGSPVLSSSNSNNIDLSDVRPGIYYLKLTTKGGKEIVKTIIKK